MIPKHFILIFFLRLISQTVSLNILFISIGRAGHVIPMFELAKGMKHDNITFLTHRSADIYIDFLSYTRPSTFRVIYANDSPNAFIIEKQMEQDINNLLFNQSSSNAVSRLLILTGQYITSLLNKSIHILMTDRFDVIVADKTSIGGSLYPLLCEKAETPCVLQNPAPYLSSMNFNLPNTFSFLTQADMFKTRYRLYNAIYNIRMMMGMISIFPTIRNVFQSLPQIPGPFYDCFTLKNVLTSKTKYLELISMPPTFYTPTYSNPYKKYMGPYIDETQIIEENDGLKNWIQSKTTESIIYATFGSTSVIPFHRMHSLLNGIATFLLQMPESLALLAFHRNNYDTYQMVLKLSGNDEFINIFNRKDRVRIENGFIQQKWILSQKQIKIFVTHCGMSSTLEGLFFQKPILCMPFSTDQFGNAIIVNNLGVGLSLFVSSDSSLQSLITPFSFSNYTFTAKTTEDSLLTLWTNDSYKERAQMMSLEMKHAGGVRRAVKEIHFFVNLNGDLDRYAPFQSTLPFYQRYMLDLIFILIILPTMFVTYLIIVCRRKRRKTKTD